MVQEPPGVGGGKTSAIWLLEFYKRLGLILSSYLRAGLRFRVVEDWVWWS